MLLFNTTARWQPWSLSAFPGKHFEPEQIYSTALNKGWLYQQVFALEKFLFVPWLLEGESYSRTIQLITHFHFAGIAGMFSFAQSLQSPALKTSTGP